MKSSLGLLLLLVIATSFIAGALADTCQFNIDSSSPSACTPGGTCQNILKALSAGFQGASNTCTSVVIVLKPGTYSGNSNVGLLLSGSATSITANLNGTVQSLTITKDKTTSDPATLDGQGKTPIFIFEDVNFEVQINTIVFKNGATKDSMYGGCVTNMQSAVDNHPFIITSSEFLNCSSEGNGGALLIDSNDSFHVSNTKFQNNKAGTNGGAVWASSSAAYISSISNCFFINNEANHRGGGVYFRDGSGAQSIVSYSVFEDNTAMEGGGLFTDSVNGYNLEFMGNSAVTNGGAACIHASERNPTRLLNFTFVNAIKGTAQNGAGFYIFDANFLLYRASVSANNATREGGAIYMISSDNEDTKNNQIKLSSVNIIQNSAVFNGGGISCKSSVSPWDNTFLQANTDGNSDGSAQVSCDATCISQYCTTCPCQTNSDHCKNCPSKSCSFSDANECTCYMTPDQYDDTCEYNGSVSNSFNPSGSSSGGLSHGAKVGLGLTFGLFLPLFIIATIIFLYIRNRRNRYDGYSSLGESEGLLTPSRV